ncbi:MAG: prenyltransferase [Candidatus Hodarchaeota archaeon]
MNFGVLIVLGSYYVQAQNILIEPIIASLPVALLITLILYINEFPDFNADKTAGKGTIVVRLGRRRAAAGYAVLMALVYAIPIIAVFLNLIHLYNLIVIVTLPLVVKCIRLVRVHYEDSYKMAPANGGTIITHLLVTLYLTLAYVMSFVSLEIFAITAVFFLIVTFRLTEVMMRGPNPEL